MILAITRSKLEWNPVDSHRSRLGGDWHLLFAADDPFTRISRSDTAVTLSRSPFHAVDLPTEEVGSFVRLDLHARSLSLRRSAGAGAGLYYTFTSDGDVLCASTVGALKKLGMALEQDERRLPELFVYSYVCPPATLFRNISAVAPGEHIDIVADRGAWRVHQRTTQTLPTLCQESEHGFDVDCATALKTAVGLTAPVASSTTVFLSGGVDSSVLCQLALRHGYDQPSLGASFPFERPDGDIERDYAKSAAHALGISHYHYVPTVTRYLVGLIEAIAAAETPLHGLQTVLLACAFRDHLPESSRLVINGHGADTLFGTAAQKAVFDAGTPWTIERLIEGRGLDALIWRVQARVRSRFVERLAQRRGFLRSLDDPDHFLWRQTRYGDVDWTCSRFGVLPHDCWTSRQAMVARDSCESWENQTLLLNLGSLNMLQTTWALMAEVTGRATYLPLYAPSGGQDGALHPMGPAREGAEISIETCRQADGAAGIHSRKTEGPFRRGG